MSDAGANRALGVLLLGVAGYVTYEKLLKPAFLKPLALKQQISRILVNIPAAHMKGDNVTFDMYVQNPNNQPISVKAIVGDVYVIEKGGKTWKIGNLDRYGVTVIKPAAETKFPFTVRLKTLQLAALLADIFAGKVSGMMLGFKGNININGMVIPVTETVKIS